MVPVAVVVSLIVIGSATPIVFKGLPPENESGDRYQALSAALRAAQDPGLSTLGALLVVEPRH